MFKLQTFLSIILKFKKKKVLDLKAFQNVYFWIKDIAYTSTMNNCMKHMTSTKCTQYYKDIDSQN